MSKKQIVAINEKLKSQDCLNKVAIALGFSDAEHDEAGRREADMYMSSVVATVMDDPKGKLQLCTPRSVFNAALDAAKMKVAIDGRKHAALVPYAGKATLQLTSAGYEHKIHTHLENSSVKSGVVYEGDKFTVSETDGWTEYEHIVADPFNDDDSKIIGVYVAISYSKGDRRFQLVERMSRKELEKVKGCSKMGAGVWNKWYAERAKTAAIKRASKRLFNDVLGLQAMVDYDNKKNYEKVDLNERSENNIIDNINNRIEGNEEEDAGGVVEVEQAETEADEVSDTPHQQQDDEPLIIDAEVEDVDDEDDNLEDELV